ncbi:MAG: S49 family peptidase [Pseudomonadota bacterium]
MSKSTHPLSKLLNRLPGIGPKKAQVTVIDLRGVIGADPGLGRSGISLSAVEPAIKAAFKPSNLDAVALAINSPGGSPVQSNLIRAAIRREAAQKEVPVLAFIEDVGASGGYLLALAGDEIYADASSIVGSIGVISAGFGFPDAIARLGIERRVYTAGSNKSQLDPFRPENEEDIARLKSILDDVHAQFRKLVEDRRKNALKNEEDLFTGAFWTGEKAKELGLIDGIGHLTEFLKARYGDDVMLKKVSAQKSPLKRLMGAGLAVSDQDVETGKRTLEGAGRTGPVDVTEALAALEARALWGRFGL